MLYRYKLPCTLSSLLCGFYRASFFVPTRMHAWTLLWTRGIIRKCFIKNKNLFPKRKQWWNLRLPRALLQWVEIISLSRVERMYFELPCTDFHHLSFIQHHLKANFKISFFQKLFIPWISFSVWWKVPGDRILHSYMGSLSISHRQ